LLAFTKQLLPKSFVEETIVSVPFKKIKFFKKMVHADVGSQRRRRSRMMLPGSSLIVSFLIGSSLFTAAPSRFQRCLPEGTKLTGVVSATIANPGAGPASSKKTTVEQKLLELKARCKKGKLVDASGREILFYRLVGCWGNPPADYQEILARQQEEIEKLKKTHTVIEMTCNPEGTQLH
jgi:hypothetical protein